MSGMVEAYKIGVELALLDKVTPELTKLTKRLGLIREELKQVNIGVKGVNKDFREWLETSKRLNSVLQSMTSRMEKLGLVTEKGATGLSATAREANMVAAGMDRAALASKAYVAQMQMASRVARGSLLTPSAGGGGRRGGGVPPVMPVPGGGKGHGRWGHVHIGPHGMGVGAAAVSMGGAMPYVMGAAIAGGFLAHSYKEDAEYEREVAGLEGNGLTTAQLNRIKSAIQNRSSKILSDKHMMLLANDAFQGVTNVDEAIKLLPALEKAYYANKVRFGDKIGDNQFQNMVKVAELRGGFGGAEAMTKQMNLMQQNISGSGGRYLPDQQRKLLNTGAAFLAQQNDKTFYYDIPAIAQELGGGPTGTGLYGIYRNWILGRTTQATANMLVKYGLAPASAIAKKGDNSGIKPGNLIPGRLYHADQLRTDLTGYLTGFYKQTLAAHGVNVNDQNAMQMIGSLLTSDKTAGKLLGIYTTQLGRVHKEHVLHGQSADINQSAAIADKMKNGDMMKANEAWKQFEKTIGELTGPAMSGMLQTGTKSLQDFTRAIQSLADWMQHNSFKNVTFAQNVGMTTAPGHGFLVDAWDKVKSWVGGGSHAPKVPSGFHVDRHKTGDVYLDGHKVGRVLDAHVARRANGPMIGGVGMDSSMSYLPTAATGGMR